MLSCKQNTELLSQALDRPITAREKLTIRLHLMICRGCSNFEKQLVFIRKASKKMADKL